MAHCQQGSSTMGILLALHLSHQHITAYLSQQLLTPCSYPDSLCCSYFVDIIHLLMRVYKHGRPIVWVFPELDIKMPGHDHSLRKLYTIEGLSNPSMVYNWICPILLKEDCPYEALAGIFSTYFKDTSGINTSEDYLNFGWAAPLFSESDWSTMKHHTKKIHL